MQVQLEQRRTCNWCSQPLPDGFRFKICADCQAAVEKELEAYYRSRK